MLWWHSHTGPSMLISHRPNWPSCMKIRVAPNIRLAGFQSGWPEFHSAGSSKTGNPVPIHPHRIIMIYHQYCYLKRDTTKWPFLLILAYLTILPAWTNGLDPDPHETNLGPQHWEAGKLPLFKDPDGIHWSRRQRSNIALHCSFKTVVEWP